MTISKKIILTATASVIVVTIASMLIQRYVIREQSIDLTHQTMRSMVLDGESVREHMSSLNDKKAIDYTYLLEELKQHDDYSESAIYGTIPVVAAWQVIEKTALEEGFKFRVPSQEPRNPDNTPTAKELRILNKLENEGLESYFEVNEETNSIVFAKPIILSEDCMFCHGDPPNKVTGTDKDILGFKMERWKAGDMHGAFILQSDLKKVDDVVASSFAQTLYWVIPITLLLMGAMHLIIRLNIIKPLNSNIAIIRGASVETDSASREISSASTTLAEGASEQAASVEEIHASLMDIEGMVNANTKRAQAVNLLSHEVNADVLEGSNEMKAMVASMQEIQNSSKNISKIISTIDEIAFQTNILALNAAIEAARAGEAGQGFSVVAEEVRNLAQRAAMSARETSSLIEESTVKTERGQAMCRTLQKSLESIMGKVQEMENSIKEVAESAEQERMSLQQATAGMNEINQATQSVASSAEETASASTELSAQAESLRETVTAMMELVGGNDVQDPRSHRVRASRSITSD